MNLANLPGGDGEDVDEEAEVSCLASLKVAVFTL